MVSTTTSGRSRSALVGVVVLLALAWCTLVPGTPVNNDPSPAAATAGIHLTTPAAHHVGAVTLAMAAFTLLATIVPALLVVVPPLAIARRRTPTADPVRRSMLRIGSAARRGPPRSSAPA